MSRELSKAQIKYLVVMYKMDPEGKGLRSISICRELDVSRPSAHAMIEKLDDKGYVKKEFYGIVYLTNKGVAAGKYYMEKKSD